MTESTRKPSARRQENTQREQNRTSRQVLSRRGAVTRAILAGASPEQLSGLLGRDGAGIPNSVLLDLLSRERPFVEREQRPLPPNPAAVEPFVWDGPFGAMETGAANALPATPFLAEGPAAGKENAASPANVAVPTDSAFTTGVAGPADSAFTTGVAGPADSVFTTGAAGPADGVFSADAGFAGAAAFTVEGGKLGGTGGPGAAGPVPG